ncbi:MAG: hypothetical protein ABI480_00475 [Chitinophagaceae bacterium]
MKTRKINTLIIALMTVFAFTGCVEHRYYNEHHYHREHYYYRHHRQPPPGIDVHIHN